MARSLFDILESLPHLREIFRMIASLPDDVGVVQCREHPIRLASVAESGPCTTAGTPPLPCGCAVTEGPHRVAGSVRVVKRGSGWWEAMSEEPVDYPTPSSGFPRRVDRDYEMS